MCSSTSAIRADVLSFGIDAVATFTSAGLTICGIIELSLDLGSQFVQAPAGVRICLQLSAAESKTQPSTKTQKRVRHPLKIKSLGHPPEQEVKIPTLSLQRTEGQGWGTLFSV